MPCRFASSGTVATSRSASRAILALNVASNFLRDLVISVLRRLRQSRTLHTLTFGPISGVHFSLRCANPDSTFADRGLEDIPSRLSCHASSGQPGDLGQGCPRRRVWSGNKSPLPWALAHESAHRGRPCRK